MSADLLRRAAEAIRKDQDVEENLGHIYSTTFDAWLAVADWLDSVAHHYDIDMAGFQSEALAVARAYMGGDA